jgi:histone H3/H4
MAKMVTRKEAFEKVKMVAKSGGFTFDESKIEEVAKAYEEYLSTLKEEEKDLVFSTFKVSVRRKDIPKLLRENKEFAINFITKYLTA